MPDNSKLRFYIIVCFGRRNSKDERIPDISLLLTENRHFVCVLYFCAFFLVVQLHPQTRCNTTRTQEVSVRRCAVTHIDQ